MSTVKQALIAARTQLAGLAEADADLDARVLLCHLLGKPPTWLYAWPDATLDADQLRAFDALLCQRAAGTPVAHLTGQREFWGLPLQVSADTLIPRPDTERLVEAALALGVEHRSLKILDLGTGSGAIALAIAHERPHWQVTATDASHAALQVAKRNARALDLTHIRLLSGPWFDALPAGERFDLILSNPPYIRNDDPHLNQGDVAHEPRSALTAGDDGLDDLRQIIAGAPQWLSAGGWLIVEHGWDQGDAVRRLFAAGHYTDIATHQDLGPQDRITLGACPAAPSA